MARQKENSTKFREAAEAVIAENTSSERVSRTKIVAGEALHHLIQNLEVVGFFEKENSVFESTRAILVGKGNSKPALVELAKLPLQANLNDVELRFIANVMLKLANTQEKLK